jgi:hypothetical protein
MKGVIFLCLQDLVSDKFGKPKWQEILVAAGFPAQRTFIAVEDVPDQAISKIIGAAPKVLRLSGEQVAEAFGEYWVGNYALRLYKPYFSGKNNAREFLLAMDEVHKSVTDNMANARPPRFEFKWKSDNVLEISYRLSRNMIDLIPGLVLGVGKYYQEHLVAAKTSATTIEVVFS